MASAQSCRPCALHHLPGFDHLPQETLSRFHKARATNHYSRGNIIFYAGNKPLGVHFLCKGRVKVYRSEGSSRIHIVRLVEAPALLGARAFFADTPYLATGEVIEPSTICFLDTIQFHKIFDSIPAVWRGLASKFARELGEAEERMQDMALRTVSERLAKFLLERCRLADDDATSCISRFAAEGRREASCGCSPFEFELARHELADYLGTTPEAVSRVLSEFRRKRWIALNGKHLKVLSPDQLRRAARLLY